LCYLYQVSGAVPYMRDAESEAIRALWRRCCAFDPKKQKMQMESLRQRSEEMLWAVVMEYSIPNFEDVDPYSRFWMNAVQYVRGAVLDFFRSERLITKRVKKEGEEVKPTMLYAERFPSLDTLVSQVANGVHGNRDVEGESFSDTFPSSLRTDASDDIRERRAQIQAIESASDLTPQETQIIRLCFHENDYSPNEVAKLLGLPLGHVKLVMNTALTKMRMAATPENVVDTKSNLVVL